MQIGSFLFGLFMMVLSLCQKFCPDKIPVIPTVRLGAGSDGEVFDIEATPDKVIKLGVRFDLGIEDEEMQDWFLYYYKDLLPVLKFLSTHHDPAYVRVYAYAHLGSYQRDFLSAPNGKQNLVLYYYIMEKLLPLSEDEKRVFHTILSHEDNNKVKDLSIDKIKKNLQGLSCGLDFDAEKVILFCENLRSSPVKHLDMHSRNIMKDTFGSFMLIDMDRCYLYGD